MAAASRTALSARVLPCLPLRDQVYFPGLPNVLHVAREQSRRAIRRALDRDRLIVVISQRDMGVEDPGAGDLYSVGTICEVLHSLPLPDGSLRASLRGIRRVRADQVVVRGGMLSARAADAAESGGLDPETEALMRECVGVFGAIVQLGRAVPPEAAQEVAHIAEPGPLADAIAHHVGMPPDQKQRILEAFDVGERLAELFGILKREEAVLRLGQVIHRRVEEELGETQREYYLREQLKVIEAELQTRENRLGEREEYLARIARAELPPAAREKAEAEVRRLDRTPSASPEGLVSRTYLDCLLEVPWNVATEDRLDLRAASKLLDRRHYGLAQVKDRILEHLAVRQLTKSLRGPILCFVGPPGVGKTSIARSIAEAMGRRFARIALGGLRDEAELRGHRRTYVGSMPGRVVQNLIACGSLNPVFVLDELDKVGGDGRSDPLSALLEILDGEQNSAFVDHYLETPIDLSGALFVATANTVHGLPAPLRDRMEIVPFSGYSDREKLAIARTFLLPDVRRAHGLAPEQLELDAPALELLVREYTRESGIRSLERQLRALARKTAREVAEGKACGARLDVAGVGALLGSPPFPAGGESGAQEAGLAWGLVVSDAGGEVVAIEVALGPALGARAELRLTGSLGEVMKESAQAALTFVRGRLGAAATSGDVHVHVPEGGVPKDGPSAGLTIAMALASAFTDRPIPAGWAMTGEISLRGRVLAVGGLREKLLAALRAGMRSALIPAANAAELGELPQEVRKGLKIVPVERADEALAVLGLSAP